MAIKVTTPEIKDLVSRVRKYLPKEKAGQVEAAYQYAALCHDGQIRDSGEPYIGHPLNAALFLADMHLDATTLVAALLHDVVEDCGITNDELTQRFGPDVSKLVDGVTKLTRMEPGERLEGSSLPSEDRLQAETLRKMLVAMAEDVRVVLIKLADRLHNMQTIQALPVDRQRAIAQETVDIYAPLAHRLGIWDIKWRLEDMAFHCLEPEGYRQISEMLAVRREEREQYIAEVSELLVEELANAKIKAQVIGRPKHIYSIHQKSLKYADQGKQMSDIYDLYAIRVTVKSQEDCYHALGVVHNLWRPMPGQFDDYIANPKENLYKSLHTTVMCRAAIPLEVQIRTYEMHQLAEFGVAAHWRYKEGAKGDVQFEQKMTWLRQLLDWQREVSGTEEFLESVKTDIFKDQVFVYTPKGKIIELPAGATPIDFAYRIHTELGHGCIGGKVNGRLMSLDYQLQNGDTVQILTTKVARGPSLDWLNPNLGYVRTAGARSSVRQWFRRQRRSTNIQLGRELLLKETKRLNMEIDERALATMFRYDTVNEFLVTLGSGGVTINQVVNRLTAEDQKENEVRQAQVPLTSPGSGVKVLGVGDLLTRLGRCCGPLPGDNIVGFITRSRGVTVHKKSCHSVKNEDERERLVDVEWGQEKALYPVRLGIQAQDRVGLLRDITQKVSEEGVNIAEVVTIETTDGGALITLTLHTSGLDQLGRLFAKLDGVRGVLSANRIIADTVSSPR
jgi:guanosine-3',5'-bis(diphosphate) 3'-pyrophosphohydrolase